MAEVDFAPAIYRANRPGIETVFGITVEPLNEYLMADRAVRAQRYYSDKLTYNRAKWALAIRIVREWENLNRFESDALDLAAEVERSLPFLVKAAESEWYREMAIRKSQGKSVTKFEPTFAQFEEFFAGLKLAKARSGSHTMRIVDSLVRGLSTLSSNDYPVEGLGYIPDTPEDRTARNRAVAVAEAAAKNTVTGAALYARVRARGRKRIPTTQTPSTTPASTGSQLGMKK